MDHIIVEGINCRVHIGVPPIERAELQIIRVDLEVGTELSAAAEKDDFRLTVDYEELVRATRETAESNTYSLVEALADRICKTLLSRFPVRSVRVRIRKFPANLEGQVDSVGIEMIRTTGDIRRL